MEKDMNKITKKVEKQVKKIKKNDDVEKGVIALANRVTSTTFNKYFTSSNHKHHLVVHSFSCGDNSARKCTPLNSLGTLSSTEGSSALVQVETNKGLEKVKQ